METNKIVVCTSNSSLILTKDRNLSNSSKGYEIDWDLKLNSKLGWVIDATSITRGYSLFIEAKLNLINYYPTKCHCSS